MEQVTRARQAILDLDADYLVHSEGADIDTLHALAYDLSMAHKELGQLKAVAEADLLNAMQEANEWERMVEGLPIARRHVKKASVKTDGALLLGRLVNKAEAELLISEDGEVPTIDVIAQHVADVIMECSGIDNASHKSWRKAKLEEHGIDLRGYQQSESAGFSVEWA